VEKTDLGPMAESITEPTQWKKSVTGQEIKYIKTYNSIYSE